jgi:monofunctional biosynthetic peptidoglycan transglycosylase
MKKGSQADKPKRSLGRRIWRFCWKGVVGFFAITIFWVIMLKWINPPTTYLQLTCDCPEGTTFHKEWVDGDKISKQMKLAVVASEDNNFMKHGGIDWGAVEKAKKYNETIGKKKGKYRGASTITQQTAKNVFLWPGKAKWSKWIRKGFEVYFTYLIEWIWGKDRIMEVYLNVIEMGPCKFGVGASAKDYFNTTADKLTRDQAALIAACLPNPAKYSVAKPGAYMKRRQGQISKLMRLIGDNYFERYGSDTSDDVREKEEKETEEKLQKLDPEEIPVSNDEESDAPVVESDSEQKDDQSSDAIKSEENIEPETAPGDSIPQ